MNKFERFREKGYRVIEKRKYYTVAEVILNDTLDIFGFLDDKYGVKNVRTIKTPVEETTYDIYYEDNLIHTGLTNEDVYMLIKREGEKD